VKVRQTKTNFGEMVPPFGIQLEFSEEKILVERYTLEAEELAKERTLNLREKVLLSLVSGPTFPKEISDATESGYQSVKNNISQLRREGLVEDTGRVESQSRQVRLTEAGSRVASVLAYSLPIGRDYAITPDTDDVMARYDRLVEERMAELDESL
jgi:DNA-binding MarR family transcriptional regulator